MEQETKPNRFKRTRYHHAPVPFPQSFVPRFWEELDQRSYAVREMVRRVTVLKEHVCADSAQKEILLQRVVFLSIRLETMEVSAAEGGEFDEGKYTQAVNSLLGLLKALGLENKAKKVLNLKSYVEGKTS
jgi:hypothetical protein